MIFVNSYYSNHIYNNNSSNIYNNYYKTKLRSSNEALKLSQISTFFNILEVKTAREGVQFY